MISQHSRPFESFASFDEAGLRKADERSLQAHLDPAIKEMVTQPPSCLVETDQRLFTSLRVAQSSREPVTIKLGPGE